MAMAAVGLIKNPAKSIKKRLELRGIRPALFLGSHLTTTGTAVKNPNPLCDKPGILKVCFELLQIKPTFTHFTCMTPEANCQSPP